MKKSSKNIKLRKELEESKQRIKDLRAQLASAMGTAFDRLPKTGDLISSGIILTLTKVGGDVVVGPVMIHGGLSPKTITALQADICKSFEKATLVNPAMATFYKDNLLQPYLAE